MTWTVSRDAVLALKPESLGDEAKLMEYRQGEIIWPATSTKTDGEQRAIKAEEIVFLAEVSGGGYVILALSEGQPSDEQPFRLSSLLASALPQDLIDQYICRTPPDLDPNLDVVVSVRSGTNLAQKFYDVVLQPFLSIQGLKSDDGAAPPAAGEGSYRVSITKDANTVTDFARKRWGSGTTARKGNETVILLSGDGGVVDLLNGMAPAPRGQGPSSLPTIALVPLGTGNALFHSLHKPHYSTLPAPSPLALALRALLSGRAAPLPTFTAAFSPGSRLVCGDEAAAPVGALTGAIVASYGFHSQLVWESDTPAYRRYGAARFGMVAQELLKEPHGYEASVAAPSGRVGAEGQRPNYVLAAMVSNLEKTFTISPESRPLDGKLWLVYFEGKTGPETMEIMKAAYSGGKHVGMPGVRYLGGDNFRLTCAEKDPRWRKVCVDGTIVELPEGGTMEVRKNMEPRLNVLVLGA